MTDLTKKEVEEFIVFKNLLNNKLKKQNIKINCSWVKDEIMACYSKINALLKNNSSNDSHYLSLDLNFQELLENNDKVKKKITAEGRPRVIILHAKLLAHINERMTGNLIVVNIVNEQNSLIQNNKYFKDIKTAKLFLNTVKSAAVEMEN